MLEIEFNKMDKNLGIVLGIALRFRKNKSIFSSIL